MIAAAKALPAVGGGFLMGRRIVFSPSNLSSQCWGVIADILDFSYQTQERMVA